MKVIHAFASTFPVTEVNYTFLYYYVIDNRRYIYEKMKYQNFYRKLVSFVVFVVQRQCH